MNYDDYMTLEVRQVIWEVLREAYVERRRTLASLWYDNPDNAYLLKETKHDIRETGL